MPKFIDIHLIDADGVLFSRKYQQSCTASEVNYANVVKFAPKLKEAIVKSIQQPDVVLSEVSLFTNRMDPHYDLLNYVKNIPDVTQGQVLIGSAFFAIEAFHAAIQQDIPECKLNTFLMSDIYNKTASGESYKAAKKKYESFDIQNIHTMASLWSEIKPEWKFDELKISKAYADMHRYATQYKDMKTLDTDEHHIINLHIYDDMVDILSAIEHIYTTYPNARARRMNIYLHHVDYNNDGEISLFKLIPHNPNLPTIIDENWEKSVLHMAKLCADNDLIGIDDTEIVPYELFADQALHDEFFATRDKRLKAEKPQLVPTTNTAAYNPQQIAVNLYQTNAFDDIDFPPQNKTEEADAGANTPLAKSFDSAHSYSSKSASIKEAHSFSNTFTDPKEEENTMNTIETAPKEEALDNLPLNKEEEVVPKDNAGDHGTDENLEGNAFLAPQALIIQVPQQLPQQPKLEELNVFDLSGVLRDKLPALHFICKNPAFFKAEVTNEAYLLFNHFYKAREENLLNEKHEYIHAIQVVDVVTRGLVHMLGGKAYVIEEISSVKSLDKKTIEDALAPLYAIDEEDNLEKCMQECFALSEKMDGSTDLWQIAKGGLLIFAGFVLISLSITAAIVTNGFTTPFTLQGLTIGAGLIEAGSAITGFLLGSVASYWGYTTAINGQQHGLSKSMHNFWQSLAPFKVEQEKKTLDENQGYVDEIINSPTQQVIKVN